MFKRRVIVMAVFACLACAAEGNAQSIMSDSAKEQLARVNALVPAWRAAQRDLQREDSLKKARDLASIEQLDTLLMPPFVVVAPHEQQARAFALFRGAWQQRRAMLEGSEQLGPVTLLMAVGKEPALYRYLARDTRMHIVALPGRGQTQQRTMMSVAFDAAMVDLFPDQVRHWLQDGFTRSEDRAQAYRELAVSDIGVNKQCLRGDATSCVSALGLLGASDWYTGDQIRALVLRGLGIGSPYLRTECIARRDVSSCVKMLLVYGGLPQPLSNQARATYLWAALRHGGKSSVKRLHAATNVPVIQAIAIAANSDANALVSEWRASLARARPSPGRQLAGTGMITVLWAGLLLAFSLRSTRGRL